MKVIKKKGFVALYLLPIFLSVIVISSEVLESVTSSFNLTNNYIGKISAKYISEIGLKHGIKFSHENTSEAEYYVNLINNKISVSNEANGSEYANVKVRREAYLEKIIVTIESVSKVGEYSKKLSHKYVVYLKVLENDVDKHLENLDTNENSNFT